MKLSQLKQQLDTIQELNFVLPDGSFVPRHFHVTEVGQIDKHFIDCGGTVRKDKAVNFQLWETAGDPDHRLAPKKLSDIISLCEKVLGIEDGEIEVEYQSGTIGKYGLEFNGENFLLTSKQTACLANEACGTDQGKQKVRLSDLQKEESCCTPGGGCC
jgi:hypothetical protein